MPDEEIDKLIRDAASQHHPPYDDTSWGKMELMLDKHLPQKKDRKKPILFLLFFLLLGSAVFFAIINYQKNNSTTIAKNTVEQKPVSPAEKGLAATADNTPAAAVIAATEPPLPLNQTTGLNTPTPDILNAKQKNTIQVNAENENGQYTDNSSKRYNQKSRFTVKIKKPAIAFDDDNLLQLQKKEKGNDADHSIALTETAKTDNLPLAPEEYKKSNEQQQVSISTKADSIKNVKAETEKTAVNKKESAVTADKKKNNQNFADKFAVTLSAGTDVSFIEIKNAGKLKPVYGAGLSYAVGKHITVSSGLYVSKKVYTALPDQYKFTGYVAPNLTAINADCKVYEIPLSVYYNFKQEKNHHWLAGISLSSLLMK